MASSLVQADASIAESRTFIDFDGGRTRARTVDPLIKSLMASYFLGFLALPEAPENIDFKSITISLVFRVILALY